MAEQEIAFRQPPGDRWKVEGSDVLFTSLTDALNSIYLQYLKPVNAITNGLFLS